MSVPHSKATSRVTRNGSSDSSTRFVVAGDLHLDPRARVDFERAREQLRKCRPEVVVCLGDLGVGRLSGTRASFENARDFLAGLDSRFEVILGNHDLENLEAFDSDAEVVRCFCDVFGHDQAFRTFELGPILGVSLSSTGFRDNRGYRHEVSIDDAQFAWLQRTFESHRDRTIAVFSHAPALGSRLQVLQAPHLRAGNAWLNQSDRPARFAELLESHPQVRLWFSGHNHLGQRYSRAVSHVGRCLFVHTGVMGPTTRDGDRHSRIVETRDGRVHIDTLDHATGARIPDVVFDLKRNEIARCEISEHTLDGSFFVAPDFAAIATSSATANHERSAFHPYRDMWVEYDARLRDPVGVVAEGISNTRVEYTNGALVARRRFTRKRIAPNPDGYYFRVPSRDLNPLRLLRESVGRWWRRGQ